MEHLKKIGIMLTVVLLAIAGIVLGLFRIIPAYQQEEGFLAAVHMYRYGIVTFVLVLTLVIVAKQFDHWIARTCVCIGTGTMIVLVLRYFLAQIFHASVLISLCVMVLVVLARILRRIREDRVRIVTGILLLTATACVVFGSIPLLQQHIDLEVILRQQQIILFMTGQEACTVERKTDNQTHSVRVDQFGGQYSLDRLPETMKVYGNAETIGLIFPDGAAIQIPSSSVLQFIGSGRGIFSGELLYDVHIAPQQGSFQTCKNCYQHIYTESLRSSVQSIYGNMRNTVPMLQKIQEYKTQIYMYRDKELSLDVMKNMRRYRYFMGEVGHIPDGDPLWSHIPAMYTGGDNITTQSVDFTPVIDATKKNTTMGASKTRYFQNRFQ